jgi:hypothetical protein
MGTTLKIKRRTSENYSRGLSQMMSYRGQKFSYAIVKNMRAFEKFLKELADYHKTHPIEKEEEFHQKRIELCEQFAEKDENGKAIIENRAYKLPEDQTEFKAAFEALKEEYKVTVISIEQRDEEARAFADEEVEVEIFTIREEHMPDDISGEHRVFLEFMIDESPIHKLSLV